MTVLLSKLTPDVWALLREAYELDSHGQNDDERARNAREALARDVAIYSYSLPIHAMEWDSSENMATAVTMSGSYFFTPKTMRMWGSRVHAGLAGGRFFITSETGARISSGERLYTVRYVYRYEGTPVLQVGDMAGLGTFSSLASARAYAKRAAAVMFGGK